MGRYRTVIAGVDGTRAGFEAVRQAARLVEPDGRLLLVAVEDGMDAIGAQWGGTSFAELDELGEWTLTMRETELRSRIVASLDVAAAQIAPHERMERRLVGGRPSEALRELALEEGADLLAVGTHGGSRFAGVVLGQTATLLAHEAPCSVLVARPPIDPVRFPAAVAVGVDGSEASQAALDVAIGLTHGHRNLVGHVVACRLELPSALRAELQPQLPPAFDLAFSPRPAADALLEAAESVDLLIVGSRGLGGIRALGSTSERVAHRASSSVLIVRTTEDSTGDAASESAAVAS